MVYLKDRLTLPQQAVLTALVVLAFLALVWALPLSAQEKSTKTDAAQAQATPAVPEVSVQDQQTYILLSVRAQVQQEFAAVVQKEVDNTLAERARLVGRLAKDGFIVEADNNGRLVYKPKPAPEKK